MKNNMLGFWYCFASYALWGVLPIYWKLLSNFDSFTILSHRIIWSFILTLILLFIFSRLNELKVAVKSFKNFASLILRALFVVSNWLIYVWAINDNRILACSLGYFLCPLAAVILGFIFLKERLSKRQTLSLIIVIAAVLNLVFNYGHFPWVSIAIALTFGFYGLLKKTAAMESLPGLSAEVAILTIPAIIYILISGNNSNWSAYDNISLSSSLLLIGTGIITAVPLLFYAFGVRRIKISTAGFLQYISPTCTFFIGIFIYGETFTNSQLTSFILIWISIIIYMYDIFKTSYSKQRK
jgi:chloramphenicol-sensitive protein RarD